MSRYEVEDEEVMEGEIQEGALTDEEVMAIQEEYRRRKLIESLIGPITSTTFHVILIILLAIFMKDTSQMPKAEIVMKMEEIEEVEIEPPIEKPEEVKVEQTETTNPVLTTVAIENAVTNDSALEDTNDEPPSTDDNMTDLAVSDVVVSPSAFASASVYGGRSASGRAGAVAKFGASKVGQDKLMKALWWLAKVQNPDGSWGNTAQPAYTGLALLTFLAHGETPTSKNFGTTVKKAMDWLVKDPINTKSDNGYPHAIKTYALCEAYAMTGVSLIETQMNACVEVLIKGQQAGGCYNYGYNTSEERQDLSFAGWNFQALKAAKGAGCEVQGLDEAIYKAIDWLKKNSKDSAQFPYSTKGNTPSNGKAKHTMRAVGSLCLQLFGEGAAVEIEDDLTTISTEDLENLNWNNPPKESLYGWYYATQSMFHAGGAKWKPWNRKFQKEIGDAQNPEGYWVYPGEGHMKGDDLSQKVYATTLCALMLTVYYRYLPSNQGAAGAAEHGKEAAKEKDKKKDEKKNALEDEGLDLVQ